MGLSGGSVWYQPLAVLSISCLWAFMSRRRQRVSALRVIHRAVKNSPLHERLLLLCTQCSGVLEYLVKRCKPYRQYRQLVIQGIQETPLQPSLLFKLLIFFKPLLTIQNVDFLMIPCEKFKLLVVLVKINEADVPEYVMNMINIEIECT